MKHKNTVGNTVMVKLDPENDMIETKSGFKIAIDTSFEPEKHTVRVGTVLSFPKKLIYNNTPDSMPWDTEMELQEGDRVIMYFLAVMNCLVKEKKAYIKEGKELTIFIKYHNIYAVIRDGKIIPINGYVLVEHMEDPAWIKLQEEAKKSGLEIPDLRKSSNTNACYGKIAYMGIPNKEYKEPNKSDVGITAKVGDSVIMKKVRDIPMEYDLHTRAPEGKKLYRIHRHDILAIL